MRLLLVEDDDNKRREIEAFASARADVDHISLARSLHGGRRSLQADSFDLVILDMTLPNYDVTAEEPGGGSVHNFGGRKLLRYMDRLELATPVVVVTQFELFIGGGGPMDIDELNNRLASSFKTIYMGIVYYHASLTRWRVDLGNFLDHASSQIEQRGAE